MFRQMFAGGLVVVDIWLQTQLMFRLLTLKLYKFTVMSRLQTEESWVFSSPLLEQQNQEPRHICFCAYTHMYTCALYKNYRQWRIHYWGVGGGDGGFSEIRLVPFIGLILLNLIKTISLFD